MQLTALFTFAFAVIFVFLVGDQFQTSVSSPLSPGSSKINIKSMTSATKNKGSFGFLNTFLSTRDEKECKAVYNASIMQTAISYFPSLGSRIKGLSKEQQYHACVRKIREAKSSSH